MAGTPIPLASTRLVAAYNSVSNRGHFNSTDSFELSGLCENISRSALTAHHRIVAFTLKQSFEAISEYLNEPVSSSSLDWNKLNETFLRAIRYVADIDASPFESIEIVDELITNGRLWIMGES